MTVTPLEPRQDAPAAVADRIGQATAVEQARAVAEVQAAIVVARQCPRDLIVARRQMLDSCGQMALAERAFFRFPRAGQTVSGPSIHLARELARVFQNVQYGISELRRDDGYGQSEMLAWAWDVENNTRASTSFIVPHRRDTKNGQVALADLRDIYENNANMGARRLREQIFAILPPWFTQEAQTACTRTLEDGGGEPLPQRIAKAVDAFSNLGVTEAQLVERLKRPTKQWTPQDVASLLVVFTSIGRGEVRVEDEFPSSPVTASEITGAQEPPALDAITDAQQKKLNALLRDHGFTDRDLTMAFFTDTVGRDITSSKDLSKNEAVRVIDRLEELSKNADPRDEEPT